MISDLPGGVAASISVSAFCHITSIGIYSALQGVLCVMCMGQGGGGVVRTMGGQHDTTSRSRF